MRVAEVRRATDEEMLDHWGQGFHPNPVVLEIDDGSVIMPSQDPELNEAGHLIGRDEDGNLFDFEVDDD